MFCPWGTLPAMSLLSELEFGTYLNYSPAGKEERSRFSKAVCLAIKEDRTIKLGQPPRNERAIPYSVRHLEARLQNSVLAKLFAGRPVLVPAPRSSPLKPESLCPTRLICQQLLSVNLGSEIQELLKRTKSVPKAAFQKASDRPTVLDHYNSIAVESELSTPQEILIVDDVITSGSMLLACASQLRRTFPQTTIRAFALIRTMSGMEIEKLVDPCVGMVRLHGERSRRLP